IRDFHVTGVQTCALPISESGDADVLYLLGYSQFQSGNFQDAAKSFEQVVALDAKNANAYYYKAKANNTLAVSGDTKLSDGQRERSEERRVGKERRSRWSP